MIASASNDPRTSSCRALALTATLQAHSPCANLIIIMTIDQAGIRGIGAALGVEIEVDQRRDRRLHRRRAEGPIASAGVNATNYGVRRTGALKAAQDGEYMFTINSDNVAHLWINGVKVIDKTSTTQGSASGKVHFAVNQSASIKVEYVHGSGAASMHLLWSNPAAKSPDVLKVVPPDSLVTSSRQGWLCRAAR
ncbi:hypothetical protein FSB08_35080 [Paraburkholderia sp. JPY432]|nr:hypothetical protein [Paraburkholderia youngii]